MAVDWNAVRQQFVLDPDVAMLNSGSFGPVPKPVFDAANRFRHEFAAGPTNFVVRLLPGYLWHARERLAAFLNVSPYRLIFQTNVSTAINLVASGLTLPRQGEILLTDHEYGAMHWCWERVAQRTGMKLKTFPLPTMANDPAEIVDAAVAAMTPQTRVFFFSHVLSPTGLVLPAKELCAEARKRGILTVIDGAHAPGMLPLDVSAVNADFYGANCHKWMLAPNGCGFLAVGPGNEDRLQPLYVSWGYRVDRDRDNQKLYDGDERDHYGSTPRIRFLEFEGSKDVSPWLATPAAIDFLTGIGWDNVRGRIAELVAYSRQKGLELGLKPATPADPRLHGAMVAFDLPAGTDANQYRAFMWERKIEIPVIERPDRLMTRVSCHCYTTEAEIDRWVAAMKKWLARS
ncbi:MAG: aminotransferase class V-fold PLP-dependent enzyme [Gemmataceae bacterium]